LILKVEVISSVISSACISNFISTSYKIGEIIKCYLLQSALNDIYKVETAYQNYIFKIYNKNKKISEINFEISFVSYLKVENIDVAGYIQKNDQNYILQVDVPEGSRYGVLIEFIDGHELDYNNELDAFLYGKYVANLHKISKKFLPNEKIKIIDINFIFETSIISIENFLQKYYKNKLKSFKLFFIFLSKRLKYIDFNDLEQVVCHGDLHGGNALMNSKEISFFDFDFCGYGASVYDLSVFRWGCIIGKRDWQWYNFIKGYKSIKILNNQELLYNLIFVAVQDLRVMNLYIMRTQIVGSQFINKYYIENRIKFMKEIEKQILKMEILK